MSSTDVICATSRSPRSSMSRCVEGSFITRPTRASSGARLANPFQAPGFRTRTICWPGSQVSIW
jgi:hypothetical protein